MKKYLKISLAFLLVIVLYLYLAHTYIYRRIGAAHLRATDDRHIYMLGRASSSQKLIYVALGDSLTAGVGVRKYEESYPYLLAASLTAGNKFIVHENFSYPGARTEDLIRDLLQPAIAAQPDIITLLIGVNDIHGYVGAEKFKENYDFILKELTAKTKAEIYLINIPEIGCHTLIFPPYSYYFDNKSREFNKIILELAKVYNLKYIDLSTPTVAELADDGPHYAADAFHPSALGYASWAKIIYADTDR